MQPWCPPACAPWANPAHISCWIQPASNTSHRCYQTVTVSAELAGRAIRRRSRRHPLERDRGTHIMFGTKARLQGATLAGLTLAALVGFAATAAAKDKLTVYTALEEEQLPVYKQAFEAANPNYE